MSKRTTVRSADSESAWRWLLAAKTSAVLAITVLVGVLYANSLRVPYLLDDDFAIEKNETIRHLWPPWAPFFPPSFGHACGRPFFNFTLALDYAVHGVSLPGYHVTNTIIHLLAALALYAVIRRTLMTPKMAAAWPLNSVEVNLLACVSALLWAAHPLQVVSVTYMAQRAESLMSLFYLLTLYCCIRAATGATHPRRWMISAWSACLLGVGTKEVIVTAPVVILLYDRIFLADSFREIFRRRFTLYAGLALCWVPLALLIYSNGGRGGTVGPGTAVNWLDYFRTQFLAIVLYIKLSFVPRPLVFDYGYMPVFDWKDVRLQMAVLAVLGMVTLYLVWRLKPAGFCLAAFFIILSPSSSVVPLSTQVISEHRMYLPLGALVALCVARVYSGWKKLAVRFPAFRQALWLPAMLGLGVTGVFGGLTRQRNHLFQDKLNVMCHDLKYWPDNPRVLNNRGKIYGELNRIQESKADYERALQLRPNYADAINGLGNVYYILGQYDKAMELYNRSIAVKKDYPDPHNNRAGLFVIMGRPEEALRDYDEAIKLRPEYVDAYINRGIVLQQMGRHQEAVKDLSRALELNPNNPRALATRGWSYYKLKQFDPALDDFELARRLLPGDYRVLVNLTAAQASAGRLADARQTARQALDLARAAGDSKTMEQMQNALQELDSFKANEADRGK